MASKPKQNIIRCNGSKKDGAPCTAMGKQRGEDGLEYCGNHINQGKQGRQASEVEKKHVPLKLDKLDKDDVEIPQNKIKERYKAYSWQRSLLKHCSQDCTDDRQIIWIVDEIGGAGKNTVQGWIADKYTDKKVLCLNDFGKDGDLAQNIKKALTNGWDGSVCLINLTRAYRNDIKIYDAIEKIKDGKFTLLKYSGGTIEIPKLTHVVVFANFMPKTEEITKDRLKIYRVAKESKLIEIKLDLTEALAALKL